MKMYREKRYRKRVQEARRALGDRCAICGSAEGLEFDHKDRSSKTNNLTGLWSASNEVFWKEVAKCQLLCKEHHNAKSVAEQGKALAAHGTFTMYRKGCRCLECRAASNDHVKAWVDRNRDRFNAYRREKRRAKQAGGRLDTTVGSG